jgi:glycosyltransferase involved in cell wall biosynthesis
MEPALVSTIIPVFNREPMLRDAVASVLRQSYRPIEIIIVDDGSAEATAAMLEALAAEHEEITVIHQPNRGPGMAREAGRLRARGAFIQYLDSDDLLEPEKFAMQVRGLEAHPDTGASYGWTRLRKPDGSVDEQPTKRTGERIDAMFPSFLQSRWWDTSTPLFRREVVDAAGPWLDIRVEEDWEYDARVASLGTRLHYCAAWVSETRQLDPGRASTKGGPAVLRERARAHALIYGHARRAGIGHDAPEMEHFARELFLLARQCGAAGLASESRMLFDLSRAASGQDGRRLQFRLYKTLARTLGWTRMGRLSNIVDGMRRR